MQKMSEQKEPFGKRLKTLRKAAGLTQQEIAQEIGVTRRIIDYYERESKQPPAYFLVDLAKIFNMTVDELLENEVLKSKSPKLSARLEKRLKQIETLSPKTKRQIPQLLDTLIEAEILKKNTLSP